MRTALSVIAALLAFAEPVGATEAASARITRVREDPGTGRVFIEIEPAVTRVCNGTLVANETYVFDADLPGGRALYAQVLSAYTVELNVGTIQRVHVLGTGTCVTVGITPFTTRFEVLSRVSACVTSTCTAP